MKSRSVKPVRCAIYTRVSTDHGLEQDFNSLDAQHDAAQAYVRSQAHAGWTLSRSRYDDGGYSGGSTERPALQRLLADIRTRKVDVIVVYKVDRLTRSLADFAKLVELFDGHGVSFVSVTQQFNTTTSMGRLTLNVLLSFAQFEREVTSERIRDKIAASKRKGLWVGGIAPLGYQTKDRKIVVVEEEAERVRTIFRRYLKLGSLNLLMADLRERGIVTKVRSLKTGCTVGGIPFTRGPLAHFLRNRFYIGEVVFKGEVLPGASLGADRPSILWSPGSWRDDLAAPFHWRLLPWHSENKSIMIQGVGRIAGCQWLELDRQLVRVDLNANDVVADEVSIITFCGILECPRMADATTASTSAAGTRRTDPARPGCPCRRTEER